MWVEVERTAGVATFEKQGPEWYDPYYCLERCLRRNISPHYVVNDRFRVDVLIE